MSNEEQIAIEIINYIKSYSNRPLYSGWDAVDNEIYKQNEQTDKDFIKRLSDLLKTKEIK